MANKERGEVRLAAGDDTYTLKLTINACCELEERSGKYFDDVVAAANAGSLIYVRWLLWATLQEHHAKTVKTPADAGRVIDRMGGLPAVSAKLTELMALNRDDREKAGKPDGKSDPRVAEAPPGGGSTSTPAASASLPTTSGDSHSENSGENSPPPSGDGRMSIATH